MEHVPKTLQQVQLLREMVLTTLALLSVVAHTSLTTQRPHDMSGSASPSAIVSPLRSSGKYGACRHLFEIQFLINVVDSKVHVRF